MILRRVLRILRTILSDGVQGIGAEEGGETFKRADMSVPIRLTVQDIEERVICAGPDPNKGPLFPFQECKGLNCQTSLLLPR